MNILWCKITKAEFYNLILFSTGYGPLGLLAERNS